MDIHQEFLNFLSIKLQGLFFFISICKSDCSRPTERIYPTSWQPILYNTHTHTCEGQGSCRMKLMVNSVRVQVSHPEAERCSPPAHQCCVYFLCKELQMFSLLLRCTSPFSCSISLLCYTIPLVRSVTPWLYTTPLLYSINSQLVRLLSPFHHSVVIVHADNPLHESTLLLHSVIQFNSI